MLFTQRIHKNYLYQQKIENENKDLCIMYRIVFRFLNRSSRQKSTLC